VRWDHSLLRCEHAWRCAFDFEPGAEQRNLALRFGFGQQGLRGMSTSALFAKDSTPVCSPVAGLKTGWVREPSPAKYRPPT
jgi:hypothetical protein